MKFLTEK